MATSAAAELKQAIWNIFPGDTVRLRKHLCAQTGISPLATSKVSKVYGNGQVRLTGRVAGLGFWNTSELVVVKQGPGLQQVEAS